MAAGEVRSLHARFEESELDDPLDGNQTGFDDEGEEPPIEERAGPLQEATRFPELEHVCRVDVE